MPNLNKMYKFSNTLMELKNLQVIKGLKVFLKRKFRYKTKK